MDCYIYPLLKDDIEAIEKISLDLVSIRDNAPYPAKQGVGLHRVNFFGKALWGRATPVFISSLNIVAPFLDNGIRIDNLFQNWNIMAVGIEVMLWIILGVGIEQAPQPFHKVTWRQVSWVKLCRSQCLVDLPLDVQ